MAAKKTYLKLLRKHSNFSGLRSLVNGVTLLSWIAAAIIVSDAINSPSAGAALAIGGAIGLVITAHLVRALSLTIADGCDALVRMAELQDLGSS